MDLRKLKTLIELVESSGIAELEIPALADLMRPLPEGLTTMVAESTAAVSGCRARSGGRASRSHGISMMAGPNIRLLRFWPCRRFQRRDQSARRSRRGHYGQHFCLSA